MLLGTVTFYNEVRAFGFIQSEKSSQSGPESESIFFHLTSINPNENKEEVIPRQGDRVSYERRECPKGFEAKNITVTRDEPATIARTVAVSLPK